MSVKASMHCHGSGIATIDLLQLPSNTRQLAHVHFAQLFRCFQSSSAFFPLRGYIALLAFVISGGRFLPTFSDPPPFHSISGLSQTQLGGIVRYPALRSLKTAGAMRGLHKWPFVGFGR